MSLSLWLPITRYLFPHPSPLSGLLHQESGRAGRDGKQSWARVYHSVKERDAQTFLINMEVNKAKTDGIKKQKQAAMKSLNVMVKYCESVACRHALFSKHFGDTPPACKNRCDACSDRKAADAKLQSFATCMDRRVAFRTAGKMDSDSVDMYGEGRRGQKREADSYCGDDDEGDGGRSREKAAKEERESEIKRQFKMRKKGKKEVEKPKAKMGLGHARVRAAEFTETKVAGLDLKTRETFCDLLVSILEKNYEAARSFRTKEMSLVEIREAGVEAEYGVFTSNKTTTMYRSKVAKIIQQVKKETSELLFSNLLATFNPPKKEEKNLASLAREVKGQLAEKESNGGTEKVKERKPGGFRMKREKDKQQTIGKFFQTKAEKSLSPDLDFTPGHLTLGVAEAGSEVKDVSLERDLECLPCPICSSSFPLGKIEKHAAICEGGDQRTEEVADNKMKSEVRNGGSRIHAISDSEDEDEVRAVGDVDLKSIVNGPREMASGSAFLDTRRRWQEKMDGSPQSHLEKPGMQEQEQEQDSHGSLHEVDPFAESDPFLGGESFINGDESSIKDDSFYKISEPTLEEMGGAQINLDESFVEGGKPEAEDVKEEQSNLAKLLDKMKRKMNAEEAERKQPKEKTDNQKVLVKETNSQREKVSSRRDRHHQSENLNSALKPKKDKHEGTGGAEVKCSKSKDLQQTDMRKENTSKRRAEDAEVAESRKRLEAKLNMKRREANGQTRMNGHQSRLDTSSNSDNSLIKSQQGKNKVAQEFVICLTPFLKNGRIVNKETFKVLARDLTHMAVETGVETTRAGVKSIVADFFHTNTEPVRGETVKELVTAFRIKL